MNKFTIIGNKIRQNWPDGKEELVIPEGYVQPHGINPMGDALPKLQPGYKYVTDPREREVEKIDEHLIIGS